MDGFRFKVPLAAFLILCLPALSQGQGQGQGGSPARGLLSLELGSAPGMETRLLLESPGLAWRLRSEADDEGILIRLGLEAGQGPALVAGPGSVSGAFRLFADPVSLGRGLGLQRTSFALDSALESGACILGLELGKAALFGLLRGAEPGFLLGRPSPEGADSSGEGQEQLAQPGAGLADWVSGASGFLFRIPLPRGLALGLLGSLAMDKGSEGGGGWEPEPRPRAPALSTSFGILLEGGEGGSSARLGLAWSRGEGAGPGSAFRLEAESGGGRVGSRVFVAAVSPSFRDLEALPPQRLGVFGLDLSLALYRAARLSLRTRLDCAKPRGFLLPPLARSQALRLSLPLPSAEPRSLAIEGRLEGEEGGAGAAIRAELKGKSKYSSWAFSLEEGFPKLGPSSSFPPGASLALALSAEGRTGSGIAARTALSLGFPGEEGGSPSADLLVELGFGLPAGGELALRLRFEEALLLPLLPGVAGQEALLELRYLRRLGLP